MSQKQKKKERGKKEKIAVKEEKSHDSPRLKDETKHSVIAIIFFALSLFFILSAWGKSGIVGGAVFRVLDILLGLGFFILPLLSAMLGVSFYKSTKPNWVITKAVGGTLFFLSSLGITSAIFRESAGGIIGDVVAHPLVALFDVYATLIFLAASLVISLLLMFDARLSFALPRFHLWGEKKENESDDAGDELVIAEMEDDTPPETDEDTENESADATTVPDQTSADTAEEVVYSAKKEKKGIPISDDEDALPGFIGTFRRMAYTPPPLSLLSGDKGKPDVGDIKANANIIKRTLQNFGITVEMDEITVGPSVTRYALKPAEGVKLSRIVGLQNDLGLALAAHPIRIEAPIPGKSLVGIEVPNSARSTVGLAGLIAAPEFKNSEKALLFTLGKGISGKSVYSDLAKLPHVLIAGATGSGKSVAIHAIITSLLYRNSPENLRFIMVDPKRVELTLYNKIPHLLTPVVTDPKRAILALKWAAKEMDRRYDILEAESVRDIASYHANVMTPAYKKIDGKDIDEETQANMPETMPYIVVVIDELADIMTSYPRELESAIVRLAQMSRAVGIHLVLSTQRPSVNVITGLIKANVPGRIALQVASQIDSRTILDSGGAEKLLGAGDMLYLSGEMSQPARLQSAFVTETEVKKVVKFLADQNRGEVPSEIILTPETDKNSLFDIMNGTTTGGEEDDLYEEAYETVVSAGKASTSYLQRKLKVGYARAARLMDMLEERGIIGPADGSKPRDVVVAKNEEGYGALPEENNR